MKIKQVKIKVSDLIEGYTDDKSTGRVTGYGGKLDIRPAYQREFVYDEKQRNAVIDTVNKGFPLNVIYWAKTGDDTYEILDGQQRTISICQYCKGQFSINYRAFHNLTDDEKDVILNYELDVYQCEGTDKEKLDWFKIINIAGERLTNQELRNITYTGPWLSDAKKKFSARNCVATHYKEYLKGSSIRQDYLETAISWIADRDGCEKIEEYMSIHQHNENASELWLYFDSVMRWVKEVFPKERKEMKGLPWGILYNKYKNNYPDPEKAEKRIKELMMDDDVTSKKGIYEYILSGEEKHLSIRKFSEKMKREAYERQDGICPYCKAEGIDNVWALKEMEADHITPWSEGGRTISENCQMLCKKHNREKGNR